jgi:hypothetical protein
MKAITEISFHGFYQKMAFVAAIGFKIEKTSLYQLKSHVNPAIEFLPGKASPHKQIGSFVFSDSYL